MKYAHLIYPNVTHPLAGIPFHQDLDGIERLAPEGFPMHTAVHRLSAASPLALPYVQPHCHAVPEINLFLPGSPDFAYALQLGDETHRIDGHCSVWIPAGLLHAANLIQGCGYFVCLILGPTDSINWQA